MTSIIMSGINGRMGKAIEELCMVDESVEIVAGIDINLGIPHKFPTVSSPEQLDTKADVIIDFSHHSCAEMLCKYAVETQTPIVFATTGYTDEELEMIDNASKKVAVFTSANMSLGVNLIISLAKQAAKILKGFDIEIIEKHHNQKLDAPSGTALMIANGIKDVREDSEYVYDRSQVRKKREANEIGIHAIRGGTIVGEHDVIFAGHNEVVTIGHSAQSREVFASGAVSAAKFIAGKPAGMYHMDDMIG